MKRVLVLSVVVLSVMQGVQAENRADFSAGVAAAARAQAAMPNQLAQFTPSQLPHYTATPKATQFYSQGDALVAKGAAEIGNDQAGSSINSHFANHPEITINAKDPGMAKSLVIQDDAKHIAHGLSDQYIHCDRQPHCHTTTTTVQCDKTRHQLLQCTRDLVVEVNAPPGFVGTCQHVVFQADGPFKKTPVLASGPASDQSCVLKFLQTPRYGTTASTSVTLPPQQTLTLHTYLWPVGSPIDLHPQASLSQLVTLNGQLRVVSQQRFQVPHPLVSTLTVKRLGMEMLGPGQIENPAYAWVTQLLKPPPIITTHWEVHCPNLPPNYCHVQTPWHCTAGQATKTIDGVPVTEPCWAQQETYFCGLPPSDSCQGFLNQGCSEVANQCVTKMAGFCVKATVTMQCTHRTCEDSQATPCGGQYFCLDGQCYTPKPTTSTDFAKADAEMAAAVGAAKSAAGDQQTLKAFAGTPMKCSLAAFGYLNCCKDDGWGKDMGLSKCSDEEKKLGFAKQKGYAIEVGSYCAHRTLGVCTSHKKSYCVFDGLMAKDVQQQGRLSQLGIPFGAPHHPNCSGISVQDLQRIDFDKIDFSNLYADLKNRVKLPNANDIANRVKKRLHPGTVGAGTLWNKRGVSVP